MAYSRDPRVDAYIDALPAWQQVICREVRDLVHAADREVAETIKFGNRPYFVLQGNICATLAFVSRAPQPDIERWKARMGWQIPWYTITDDFDADFGVDEWHGTNAFFRDGDRIFRTYSVNNRGDEAMGSTWSYLDITALGRQEEWEDSPEGYPQTPPYQWWNLHDEYGETA
jgi:Bacterial protein of unknown function (DUF899)